MKEVNSEEVEFIIYGLVCPIENKIMYVGATANGIRTRLADHIFEAKAEINNTSKSKWIRELRKQGLSPTIVAIEKVIGATNAQISERRHTDENREKNKSLVNHKTPASKIKINTGFFGFKEPKKAIAISEETKKAADKYCAKMGMKVGIFCDRTILEKTTEKSKERLDIMRKFLVKQVGAKKASLIISFIKLEDV